MRTEQQVWSEAGGWPASTSATLTEAHLVLVFGPRRQLLHPELRAGLRARYPEAIVIGCSTAGEIAGPLVLDGTVVATAIGFDSTTVRLATTDLRVAGDSFEAGRTLASELASADGLSHVLTLSEGLTVNGSQLADGLATSVPPGVSVSGGLAGDGTDFAETAVLADSLVGPGVAAAVGFYGPSLRVRCASVGGWDPFGPERVVTRSDGNVLYELDGQSALGLYKRYLGAHAAELPASALLFPLAIRTIGSDQPIVRTILSVDEEAQSMTFAGDVPAGAAARLMKASADRLIDGATAAARACRGAAPGWDAQFALLVSCVGRRLVLKQRTDEEVEAVQDVVGRGACLAGFYSYGEISPFADTGPCRLHNQTMTITTLAEV